MGKQRRVRQKLHTSLNTAKNSEPHGKDVDLSDSNYNNTLPLPKPDTNIFANINIDFKSLKKDLNDDVKSIKSLRSTKLGDNDVDKVMKKKEKMLLRKQLLLRKIDTVNQFRRDIQRKKKNRKKLDVVSDVKSLLDSLPSLEPLKAKDKKLMHNASGKVKGIQKASKRKIEMNESVKNFKKIINLDAFKKNPFEAVQNHIDKFVKQNNV